MTERASRKTVLVVDDQPDVLEITAEILAHAGYRVRVAAGAAEALEVFREADPPVDIVVTDYEMPEMDGLEMTRELGRGDDAPAVVVMSSHAREEELRREAAAAGIVLLDKPFDPQRLLSSVEAALLQRRGAAEEPESTSSATGSRSRTGRHMLLGCAALALATLVALLFVYSPWTAPPDLPAPPAEAGTVRSGTLELLLPEGDVHRVPDVFVWEARPEAASYRVTIEAVDGEPLLTREVPTPMLDVAGLSPSPRLLPGVVYHWRVEALAGDGRVLAGSPRSSFRIPVRPDTEEAPT